MEWVSLALGALGVVAGVPALWLSVRAERRNRERHKVDWTISFCHNGRLHVDNRGPHTARRVVLAVETSAAVGCHAN